jgi:tether containing UBX domain for GLUT4
MAGAGRLFYEMPVLNVLNREFSSLEDLQKTLSQLGVTSGSILIRLSFKDSQKPLEEAMQNISKYFKAEPDSAAPEVKEDVPMTDSNTVEPSTSLIAAPEEQKPEPATKDSIDKPSEHGVTAPTQQPDENSPPVPSSSSITPSTPSLTVYKPTTTTTPLAATQPFNESDYIPTIEHAQKHQSRLVHASRNKRLPSDAELARTANSKAAVTAAVSSVNVRVRLPDLTMLETRLERGEANASRLYELVRGVMRSPQLPFVLRFVEPSGVHVALKDDEAVDLIGKLRWRGNVLVSMVWEDGVDVAARKGPVLKPEAMSEAKSVSVVVPDAAAVEDEKDDKKAGGFFDGLGKALEKGKGKLGGAEKEAKLKNLLGFGKKK